MSNVSIEVHICLEWFKSQNVVSKKADSDERYQYKHIIEEWSGWYISKNDAFEAMRILGLYEGSKFLNFNKLVCPSMNRCFPKGTKIREELEKFNGYYADMFGGNSCYGLVLDGFPNSLESRSSYYYWESFPGMKKAEVTKIKDQTLRARNVNGSADTRFFDRSDLDEYFQSAIDECVIKGDFYTIKKLCGRDRLKLHEYNEIRKEKIKQIRARG